MFVTVLHHLDNRDRFKTDHPILQLMWEQTLFSILLATYLAKLHVVVKIKLNINDKNLCIDIYEQINSENSILFEVVETVHFPF